MQDARLHRKTPPLAAFFVCTALLAGCGASDPALAPDACGAPAVPIGEIQGQGPRSALQGETVDVRGIVTAVLPGEGVFIESAMPDTSPATSEGLFVASRALSGEAATGTVLAVRGTVRELGERQDTQTALVDIAASTACGEAPLPLSQERLPLDDIRREALESMRLQFVQPLYVTDVYRLGGGELSLAAGAPLRQPTDVVPPGAAARDLQRENARRTLAVRVPPAAAADAAWGAPLPGIAGVLGHDGRGLRLLAGELGLPPGGPPPPPTPPAGDGALRVVNLNLRNYFNGDGRGAGFPTPRGAETPRQFEDQRGRLRATLAALSPHVLAVQELENDGFDEHSAAASVLEDLAAATGRPWAEVRPSAPRVGTDEIRVGLFYDPAAVTPAGPARLLGAVGADRRNRVPIAQVFAHAPSGQRFVVSTSHLKSKGSCPEGGPDAAQGDGQGCWNAARTRAAGLLARAMRDIARRDADGAALVLGDLNAYRREDPLEALREAGFEDLLGRDAGAAPFTYVFRGAAGVLDHALATPALARHVEAAFAWNVNSVYADGVPAPAPWARASDHDAVVVDLRLRQSATMD